MSAMGTLACIFYHLGRCYASRVPMSLCGCWGDVPTVLPVGGPIWRAGIGGPWDARYSAYPSPSAETNFGFQPLACNRNKLLSMELRRMHVAGKSHSEHFVL